MLNEITNNEEITINLLNVSQCFFDWVNFLHVKAVFSTFNQFLAKSLALYKYNSVIIVDSNLTVKGKMKRKLGTTVCQEMHCKYLYVISL